MPCIPCFVRLHEECLEPVALEGGETSDCCCYGESDTGLGESMGAPQLLRVVGDSEEREYKDVLSTGRKRAAQLKPIIENMVCEWAGLRYAGGGVVPIVGCRGTVLTKEKGKPNTGHIHHGPDKSVFNNTDQNLHRVCTECHIRWHHLNNPHYSPDRPEQGAPYLPQAEWKEHDKHTLASEDELAYNEAWWKLDPKVKQITPYRLVVSDEQH